MVLKFLMSESIDTAREARRCVGKGGRGGGVGDGGGKLQLSSNLASSGRTEPESMRDNGTRICFGKGNGERGTKERKKRLVSQLEANHTVSDYRVVQN
jgi:hypothetical protein